MSDIPSKPADIRYQDLRFDAETGRLNVPLWYPRSYKKTDRRPGNPASVEVELVDVRAADSIRIEYDFDRDGYSIKQASTFEWELDDDARDADWQEVAFIQAWAREKKKPSPA